MSDRSLPLRSFFPALLLLVAAGLSAQEPKGAQPLPAGPDSLTMKRYQAEKARFWAGVLLAECKAGNAVRAEWQQDVDDLMTVYAEVFAARIGGGDRAGQCARLCERLRGLGCEDGVVQLVSADVAFYQRKLERAREAYAAAAKAIAGRPSPLLRYQLQASRFVFHSAEQQQAAAREAAAARDACLVELAASPTFDGGKERYLLDLVLQSWNGRVGPDDLAAIERMEKAAGKPTYALLVLHAMYHNTMAWAARGQGPARSVSEADRKAFGEHLTAAVELLAQAYKGWPQHPEAPTAMLKNLGPGGVEPEDLRTWFDRAVAAQFDWKDAYLSYLHYLQPRWGGSQQALDGLGRECLATGRFDTEVPSFYRLALHYQTLGGLDPGSLWKRADVQKRLAELDAGCLQAAVEDSEKLLVNTHRMAALALGGKAKEAAALCEQGGRHFEPKALEIYGVTEAWFRNTLRPHFKNYEPAVVASGDLFAGSSDAKRPGIAKAKPLTAHADAVTSVQSRARFARWIGATYVAAYEKGSKHEAAWDADARALLAAFGDMTVDGVTAKHREVAERLLAADCKDPLVVLAVIRALGDDDAARMAGMLAKALPALARTQPPLFSWWAKGRLSDLATSIGRPGVGSGLVPEIREHMTAAATDAAFAGDNRRLYVRCVWFEEELARAGNDWVTDRVVASLSTLPGVDPWVLHVVTGLHAVRKARHQPGSANEQAALLSLAAEHLGKAHALCPQFPEAAVGMIFVTTLAPGEVSPREWFDRAVAAEIDYEPAYRAYVESLRPRRGGSIQAMHRFAVECLDSGRFDCDVPLWYARTLQRIQEEVRAPREVWASRGVAADLERMFAGYEASGRFAATPAYLPCGRCVLAWAAGRYDDALAAWDAAGHRVDPRWLTVAGQSDAELVEFDLRHLESRRAGK